METHSLLHPKEIRFYDLSFCRRSTVFQSLRIRLFLRIGFVDQHYQKGCNTHHKKPHFCFTITGKQCGSSVKIYNFFQHNFLFYRNLTNYRLLSYTHFTVESKAQYFGDHRSVDVDLSSKMENYYDTIILCWGFFGLYIALVITLNKSSNITLSEIQCLQKCANMIILSVFCWSDGANWFDLHFFSQKW